MNCVILTLINWWRFLIWFKSHWCWDHWSEWLLIEHSTALISVQKNIFTIEWELSNQHQTPGSRDCRDWCCVCSVEWCEAEKIEFILKVSIRNIKKIKIIASYQTSAADLSRSALITTTCCTNISNTCGQLLNNEIFLILHGLQAIVKYLYLHSLQNINI